MSTAKVGDHKHGGSGATRAMPTAPRLLAHSPQPVALPASLDTRAFRQTMGLLATGVTVITTRFNDSDHGMTASAVTSVSLEPLLMLAAIHRRARMCNIIQQAGEFAINILSERQQELARHFAGAKTGLRPASLRFESYPDDGVPYILGRIAAIRCRVWRVLDGGDHIIALGRVVHFHDGPLAKPLLHFGGRYCTLRDHEAPSTLGSEPRSTDNLSLGLGAPAERTCN